MLRDAKRAGVRVTAETCPHYLTFTAEEIPDGATHSNAATDPRGGRTGKTVQGLTDGTIDMVVTDHSPCTAALKNGSTLAISAGVGRHRRSTGSGLSAVWTQARQRGISLTQVVRWMAEHPADLVGCPPRAGSRSAPTRTCARFAPDASSRGRTNLHHATRSAPTTAPA